MLSVIFVAMLSVVIPNVVVLNVVAPLKIDVVCV
jgi:hypothetical protein